MAETDLASRCKRYLADGPPSQMTNFVPDSLTAVIIAHGARNLSLDSELREIGSIILQEAERFDAYEDPDIRNYMKQGAALVSEVLSRPTV